MDIEKFREYCLSLPCTTEDFPFDETVLVFRVKNKIFACIALDNPELGVVKCDPDYAVELRDHYTAIEPAYHWNKQYWNQIWFNRDVTDELLCKLINHSFAEVVKKLPKKEQTDELKANKMRKHWLDNLRWTTVIIVLIYHVFYFYNAKGVFGGIGGFYETQPQDAIMSLIYPWIMMLLFVVAGMSSKYALDKCSHKEFIKSRTRKLLVPATIGLFVFQWMTGYFNTQVAGVSQGIADKIQTIPAEARYIACALSGTGPLWFIQDLWLFSLILILIRLLKGDRIHSAFGNLINNKANNWIWILIIVLGGYFVVWGATQTNISYPEPNSGEGLWNLYRPAEYFITFLMGYFVFSHDKVIELAKRICLPMLAISLASGIVFAIRIYGLDDTNPIVLKDWLTNIFAWSTILSLIGCFAKWTDKTSRFAAYMAKSSFGIYVMHYLVIASLGYMLKMYTQLPPLAIYAILLASVLLISPALNELISRIPFIRWCVLGINKRKRK